MRKGKFIRTLNFFYSFSTRDIPNNGLAPKKWSEKMSENPLN
jgi:hypothetical protein